MNIQSWNKSAYVTIDNPPFFRLEGFPSEEGRAASLWFPYKYHINAVIKNQSELQNRLRKHLHYEVSAFFCL